MITKFYVIGGQQRLLRPLHAMSQDWEGYEKAKVLEVEPDRRLVEPRLEYVSPADVCAREDSPIHFQAGTMQDGRLYLCTHTEVLVYEVPSWKQVAHVSHPYFNDVHHVRPSPAGNLLVANAGLEMVIELTTEGEVVRLWNVLGEDPWERFSPEQDYRKVFSTKPHRSHPNYVFCLGDEIWVTRFHQGDAVCLTIPGRRVHISDQRIHDGLLHDGHIYFTTVDARVVVVNAVTLRVDEVVDLNLMHPEGTLPGWCRGIVVDGSHLWVGFSRIRPTKVRENVSWVLRGFKRTLGTHLAGYDLSRQTCIAEVDLEPFGLNAIFSVFPAWGERPGP
jgi:hypothetical protein